jgi:hypothetical protein
MELPRHDYDDALQGTSAFRARAQSATNTAAPEPIWNQTCHLEYAMNYRYCPGCE